MTSLHELGERFSLFITRKCTVSANHFNRARLRRRSVCSIYVVRGRRFSFVVLFTKTWKFLSTRVRCSYPLLRAHKRAQTRTVSKWQGFYDFPIYIAITRSDWSKFRSSWYVLNRVHLETAKLLAVHFQTVPHVRGRVLTLNCFVILLKSTTRVRSLLKVSKNSTKLASKILQDFRLLKRLFVEH